MRLGDSGGNRHPRFAKRGSSEMNLMFKRIAALLSKPAETAMVARRLGPAEFEGTETAGYQAADEEDFRDTDIAIAWLCEASNKSRLVGLAPPS
jgi:hypothetical protein